MLADIQGGHTCRDRDRCAPEKQHMSKLRFPAENILAVCSEQFRDANRF